MTAMLPTRWQPTGCRPIRKTALRPICFSIRTFSPATPWSPVCRCSESTSGRSPAPPTIRRAADPTCTTCARPSAASTPLRATTLLQTSTAPARPIRFPACLSPRSGPARRTASAAFWRSATTSRVTSRASCCTSTSAGSSRTSIPTWRRICCPRWTPTTARTPAAARLKASPPSCSGCRRTRSIPGK